ncbi:hypothetical protein H8N03_25320 [Ramlibacter sp. USB13]|uniref:DUF1570 domain-containing protein n=1 Tax=Ramlibacter cellulosilyticus TaxID=2764187 RepID=A0A923SEH3_9BURK|nr:hypothetical protein [Ramlibacter cellulosilyticus]MBC5786283.1 hypothetical protein [Ramlibacter cellulosilyticus]
MFGWLKGKPVAEPPVERTAPYAGDMPWLAGTTLPIPDWDLLLSDAHLQPGAEHAQCSAMAAAWLDAMGAALGGYRRDESPNFMLLSPLEARPARVLLDYLERSRRRVLATLAEVASDEGWGKTAVMVFAGEEAYYTYISGYDSGDAGQEAFSAGMFIDAGYGHFVFTAGPFETMEPVIVHELTHCLVRHLPLPAWLNEGLAVNTEHRYSPGRPRYRPNELEFLFRRFWNARTIQEFWSGKSFLRPDDGQPLSYELARWLVQLLGKDYAQLARFCGLATRDDAGESAAASVFGAGLQDLAEVVLGPGDWAPKPATWSTGTERGQFRFTPNP